MAITEAPSPHWSNPRMAITAFMKLVMRLALQHLRTAQITSPLHVPRFLRLFAQGDPTTQTT